MTLREAVITKCHPERSSNLFVIGFAVITTCCVIELVRHPAQQVAAFGLNIGIPSPAPRRTINSPRISSAIRMVFSRLKNGYLLKYILILESRTNRGEVPIPNKNMNSPEYKAL
jgi:hypothetical protein